MLATPYCPRDVVASEFFIPGTDPISECTVHMGSTLYPDTSGIGAYPPGAAAGSTYVSPGQVLPIDTNRATVVVPGRVGRPQIDSSPRPRDTTIYGVPRTDTSYRFGRPDTVRRIDSLRRDTLLKRLDSLRRPRPDTSRVRPDTPWTHSTRGLHRNRVRGCFGRGHPRDE